MLQSFKYEDNKANVNAAMKIGTWFMTVINIYKPIMVWTSPKIHSELEAFVEQKPPLSF